jgi:prevent-host-death family protein
MSPRPPRKKTPKALPLSEARAKLSPLVEQVESTGPVAITVHGEVKAYLVSPLDLPMAGEGLASYGEEPRRKLRGSLKLLCAPDDLERIIKANRKQTFLNSIQSNRKLLTEE